MESFGTFELADTRALEPESDSKEAQNFSCLIYTCHCALLSSSSSEIQFAKNTWTESCLNTEFFFKRIIPRGVGTSLFLSFRVFFSAFFGKTFSSFCYSLSPFTFSYEKMFSFVSMSPPLNPRQPESMDLRVEVRLLFSLRLNPI